MATGHKGSFWRTCRVYFRRVRISVWLLILGLLGVLLYLNQVGLPGFAKRPLLESLRARGLDLQFSRLRLSWDHGLVAENVRFGRPDDPRSPQLTLAQVQMRLNYPALARRHLQVDSLVLRNGRLAWPIAETNQAPRQLIVERIQSDLRFLPGDEWVLDHFTALFADARIQLSGTVTNASSVREWKLFQSREAPLAGGARRPDRLRQVADTLERIHFSATPELRLEVRGDARDLASFAVHVRFINPGADTPWGLFAQGQVDARLLPATNNGLSGAELNLDASEARTRWGSTTNLQLTARFASFESLTNLGNADLTLCAAHATTRWGSAANLQLSAHLVAMEGQTNLVNAEATLWAGSVQTQWGGATNAQLHAQWMHALTNSIPLAGEGSFQCAGATSRWASARTLRLEARLARHVNALPPLSPESWGWWAELEPYALDWDCQLAGFQASGLEVDQVTCGGQWRAPALTITNLHAALAQQQLDVRAGLDVATRALQVSLVSDVDPHKFSPLLTEGARRWLAPYSWEKPPELKGDASLVLPAWTNRQPDWRAEVQPTLRLQAEFKLPRGAACRGVAVSAVESHISYSNLVWRLPDLRITRPEGRLEAALEADDRTRDFHFNLHSTVNVLDLRPLLDPGPQRALNYFTFTEPPTLDAEIWGRWHDPERIGISGRVALTNFTFRGESASGLQTVLQYTNRLLQFTAPRLQRGAERLSADAVVADFAAQKVYLTNGYSTAEPMVIARAIGAHVARAIQAYQFKQPPVAEVRGIIPMHGEDDADLHFDLHGRDFEWWRFHVPEISGHVHWLGQHLTLSNVWAGFYGGQAAGSARFDFHPKRDTDYRFIVTTTNALLQPLVADLFLKTNNLEGRLSGTLGITSADTSAVTTWNGRGNLALRDGLIWDIRLFGIFSPVLNGMVPGMGNSRASAGNCTFAITNGIIFSDDMEFRCTGMRLQYRGTLDFDGRVQARAEAELLRDTWVVGPIVSTVLWPVTKLFEYKVTGTLGDPKGEPVFLVPKVMFLPFQLPFHPLRTLKGLFPEDHSSSRTNMLPFRSLEPNLTTPGVPSTE